MRMDSVADFLLAPGAHPIAWAIALLTLAIAARIIGRLAFFVFFAFVGVMMAALGAFWMT